MSANAASDPLPASSWYPVDINLRVDVKVSYRRWSQVEEEVKEEEDQRSAAQ